MSEDRRKCPYCGSNGKLRWKIGDRSPRMRYDCGSFWTMGSMVAYQDTGYCLGYTDGYEQRINEVVYADRKIYTDKEGNTMNPCTIKIDDTIYIKQPDDDDQAPIRIVVVDRGWVFVGRVTEEESGNIIISDARCIRRWGTDECRPGLGWLASNGPTEKTKLDPSGTVHIPLHSIIALFDVSEDKWN